MPLNEAITLAGEIKSLREALRAKQDELVEVNARRTQLQTEITTMQATIVLKRTEFRQAAQDA